MTKCEAPSAAPDTWSEPTETWPPEPAIAASPIRPCWLVVDDDTGVLKFLAPIVSALAKVETQGFTSGVEALKVFEAAPHRFQGVVTDLDMPRMSGIEFCRRLRLHSPNLKVLLVTGSGLVNQEEALAHGFCGLLTKPFTLQDLQESLETAGMMEAKAKHSLSTKL